MFLVGDGVPANLAVLSGDQNDGTVGQQIPEGVLAIKLTDQYGVPVSGAPVTWLANNTGSSLQNASATPTRTASPPPRPRSAPSRTSIGFASERPMA